MIPAAFTRRLATCLALSETPPTIQMVKSVRSVLIVTLFLAGTDTTYKTLAFALYLLARDKELHNELRTEAIGVDLKATTLQDLCERLPRLKSFLHDPSHVRRAFFRTSG
jgi:cytochrome P450